MFDVCLRDVMLGEKHAAEQGKFRKKQQQQETGEKRGQRKRRKASFLMVQIAMEAGESDQRTLHHTCMFLWDVSL